MWYTGMTFEVKVKPDTDDITEYPHDDMPATGTCIFGFSAFWFVLLIAILHDHSR